MTEITQSDYLRNKRTRSDADKFELEIFVYGNISVLSFGLAGSPLSLF